MAGVEGGRRRGNLGARCVFKSLPFQTKVSNIYNVYVDTEIWFQTWSTHASLLDIRKQSVAVGVDNVKQASTFSCMVDLVGLIRRRNSPSLSNACHAGHIGYHGFCAFLV